MRTPMTRIVPDFLIIGMPKAATTSLYETLKEHPGTAACYWKEPLYWASDIRAAEQASPNQEHRRARFIERYEDYVKAFPDTGGLTFEASTHYVYSATAPALVRKRNPRCKAILVLREPTSWVASWYQQLRTDHLENLEIEDAYARSATRVEAEVPEYHDRMAVYDYKTMALPVEAILGWKRAFGEDLLALTYEELTRTWPATRTRILDFLGLEDAELELFRVNEAKRSRLRGVSRTIEWVFPKIQPILSRTPRGVLWPIRKAYRRVFFPKTSKPAWRPPKTDFEDGIARLATTLGLDLSAQWNP